MTGAFLDSVLDVLLPAEAAPPAGSTPLPAGRTAGVGLANHGAAAAVLDLIRDAAGGEEAFTAAPLPARRAVIAQAEASAPEAFPRLLALILADYCETPAVLTALGGAIEPPQPKGQILAGMDKVAQEALETVRRRARLWRG